MTIRSFLNVTASPATPAKRGLKFSFDTPTPAMKKPRSGMLRAASQAIVASSSQQSIDDNENSESLEYVDPPQKA